MESAVEIICSHQLLRLSVDIKCCHFNCRRRETCEKDEGRELEGGVATEGGG